MVGQDMTITRKTHGSFGGAADPNTWCLAFAQQAALIELSASLVTILPLYLYHLGIKLNNMNQCLFTGTSLINFCMQVFCVSQSAIAQDSFCIFFRMDLAIFSYIAVITTGSSHTTSRHHLPCVRWVCLFAATGYCCCSWSPALCQASRPGWCAFGQPTQIVWQCSQPYNRCLNGCLSIQRIDCTGCYG